MVYSIVGIGAGGQLISVSMKPLFRQIMTKT